MSFCCLTGIILLGLHTIPTKIPSLNYGYLLTPTPTSLPPAFFLITLPMFIPTEEYIIPLLSLFDLTSGARKCPLVSITQGYVNASKAKCPMFTTLPSCNHLDLSKPFRMSLHIDYHYFLCSTQHHSNCDG